jgi:UDP-glucose 4-epimerase
MNILVTGGAGYIGSHAVMRLLEDGHAVTVIDNLVRGNRDAIDVLSPMGDLAFFEADCGDVAAVAAILRERGIELVMHFAALAYVGESVHEPLRYYRANTASALGLLEAMHEVGVSRMVFSSTCATYGEPDGAHIPITEQCPQAPINPYGRSKLHVEHMLRDYCAACAEQGRPFGFIALRYFNVAGADREARIGEDHDPETHLIPICLQAALGQREQLTIFGTDYPTPDGTCQRDYVHVEDLIDAHVRAMGAIEPGDGKAFNVGVGAPYSVREVLECCRAVTGAEIPAVEGARREGDPPTLYNDPARIMRELGWTPTRSDLNTIVQSAWRWHSARPQGYQTR